MELHAGEARFSRSHGVEIAPADECCPRTLRALVAGSEIRYFSDMFRYAVLYEHGGLWMDTDVILLRPFPFRGSHFLNLQWRGGRIRALHLRQRDVARALQPPHERISMRSRSSAFSRER